MKISLIVIFLLILVFLFRLIVLERIKRDNRYREPSKDNHVAIPSIKIVNITCFSFVLLCMAIGLVLFEFFYSTPGFAGKISWYIMMACIGLSGLYYAIILHTQYFYFSFREDYMEFNLKIGKRYKDSIKIFREEIESINENTNKYDILLKDRSCYSIASKKIECLVGSELLKEKLANFAT